MTKMVKKSMRGKEFPSMLTFFCARCRREVRADKARVVKNGSGTIMYCTPCFKFIKRHGGEEK